MLITRTPVRISLGGGGTDLPSYYRRFGGVVVAAAINRYVYIAINRTFTDDYFLKYSELERVKDVRDIRHPIFREALTLHQVGPSVEVVSLADIPSGTGLGSSGTFTVGLLRALYAFKREHVVTNALAEEACRIEIERLSRSVGKQDQYIAAFGGLTCFEFSTDGEVTVSPLRISNETLHDLEERLLLFFTGYSRSADTMLDDQKQRSESGDQGMLENLHTVARIGKLVKEALEDGDLRRFAALMHEHWEHKRARTGGMSSNAIDRWYEVGRASGALGGKLVGAGGGGFLMFYAEQPASLREAMAREGLAELRFSFDHDGSSVIVRD
ncbi:MAG: galactokinase [Actinobacteria bacterium 13_1_20CM_3_68_9]|nr:MAG: galactokinase [Actinobacteria bacterium 13_1_20CM_3_68_9]